MPAGGASGGNAGGTGRGDSGGQGTEGRGQSTGGQNGRFGDMESIGDFEGDNASVGDFGGFGPGQQAADQGSAGLSDPGATRSISHRIGDFFNGIAGWASNNPKTAAMVGSMAFGLPAVLGPVVGTVARFGGFENGIPGGNKAGLAAQNEGLGPTADQGGSGGFDDGQGGGLPSLLPALTDTTPIAPRIAREIPTSQSGVGASSIPTYDELYARYSQKQIAPGSESYANPNLFAYGLEAYRYDPNNDYFTSVYSGNQIANTAGSGGIAAL